MLKDYTGYYKEAKGWLTDNERNLLKRLGEASGFVEELDAVILNIGIEYGASVHCLRAGTGRPIVAVDIIGDEKFEGDIDKVDFIRADSADMPWNKKIAVAFIDGDHGYAGVTYDCRFADYVVSGGYIAFHDCYEWPPAPPKNVRAICPDVNRAVQDWFDKQVDWIEGEPVDSIRVFRRV